MKSNDEKELQQFARKVESCISAKHLKASLLLEYKPKKSQIHGMRIPFIFALSYLQKLTTQKNQEKISVDAKSKMRSFFFTCLTLNLFNSTTEKHFIHTAEETHLCCERQDFHLLPFKKRILENTLSFRNIVGWKIPGHFIAKKRLNTLIDHFSRAIPSKPYSIKVISSHLDMKRKEELDEGAEKTRKEQLEVLRLQKEQRHFQMARIINYFTR